MTDEVKNIKSRYKPVTYYPPQCCASCEWLGDNGECAKHGPVPLAFIEQPNECEDYMMRVPF